MQGDSVSRFDGTPLFFVQKEILDHKLIVTFPCNPNRKKCLHDR